MSGPWRTSWKTSCPSRLRANKHAAGIFFLPADVRPADLRGQQDKRSHPKLHHYRRRKDLERLKDPFLFVSVGQLYAFEGRPRQSHTHGVGCAERQLKAAVEKLVRVEKQEDYGCKRGGVGKIVAPFKKARRYVERYHEGRSEHGHGKR